jgi:Flp pilus assembly protein TadG
MTIARAQKGEKKSASGARGLRGLHANRKGAVLVEFLIAFMPLMITFSSFVQLAQIATASIVTKHATIIAARAAAVISNGHNNTPDAKQGDNQQDITDAVTAGLGPWAGTMTGTPTVTIKDQSSGSDVFGMIEVTVTAQYRCSVPFGGMLVCGTNGGTHQIVKTAAYPHQGGCYTDLKGGGC